MRKTTLFITGVALFSIASCSGNKYSETTTAEAAADSTTSGKKAVGDATDSIIATYTDINDGSTLTIENTANSALSVKISLLRLTDIDDGIGKVSDGALTFTATDAAGQPIGGRITFNSDTAHLTFTESTWEYLPEGTTYSFVRGAKVDYEQANPIGGRTYTGSGNGGGLATTVTIKFGKDGKCRCTSDFYQAFTQPIAVDGTYSIRYDIVEVRCQPAGFDAPIVWDFEIIDDGQGLGFNNSDLSEEGSIGTDWLRLTAK